MNILIKSLTALSLLTGTVLLPHSAVAASAIVLPVPAPAQAALTALCTAPSSPLPSGTQLLSVRIVDGLATVNFSQEMQDNFRGGDSAETLAVNAILRTLGQFPTISRVQILVAGHPIDTLGGLLTLSDPLPVIRPSDNASGTSGKRWLHRKPRPASHSTTKPTAHAS